MAAWMVYISLRFYIFILTSNFSPKNVKHFLVENLTISA